MDPVTLTILYYSSGVIITTISTYYISIHVGKVIYENLEKNIDKYRLYL
jgi:hypothetical protein